MDDVVVPVADRERGIYAAVHAVPPAPQVRRLLPDSPGRRRAPKSRAHRCLRCVIGARTRDMVLASCCYQSREARLQEALLHFRASTDFDIRRIAAFKTFKRHLGNIPKWVIQLVS